MTSLQELTNPYSYHTVILETIMQAANPFSQMVQW